MGERLFFTWIRKFIRTPSAADYIVQFPFEQTPYMLLGNGMPTAKTFDPVSRVPAFEVPLAFTTSGVGGTIHGDYQLTPLQGVESGVGL